MIGLSMQLYDQSGTQSFGSCCTLDDLHDARRVASASDSPITSSTSSGSSRHGDLELRRRVHVRPHADSVRALQQRSEVLDAARPRARARRGPLATGHYARVEQAADGRCLLRRSLDPDKDQSYFLFSLTQDQLARAVFPVGALVEAGGAVRRRVDSGCWSQTSRTARRSASSPTATTRRSSSRERAGGRGRRDRQ